MIQIRTIQQFKALHNLRSAPGIDCIHRLKRRKTPRHLKRTTTHAAFTFPKTTVDRMTCVPPFAEHIFGFRTRADGQPWLVFHKYFDDEKQLAEIERVSHEYAQKNGVRVRLSVNESWWCPGRTVAVIYSPGKFLKPRLRGRRNEDV